MVKISELLRHKIQVENLHIKQLTSESSHVSNAISKIENCSDALKKLAAGCVFQNGMIKKYYDQEFDRINDEIKKLEPKYLEASRAVAPTFYSESYEQRKNNRAVDDKFEKFVIGINEKYGDFRYAGLELYPITGNTTKKMVSFEPLYVVDHVGDNLSHTVSMFNEAYQHKLRTYEVDLTAGIGQLPRNTMGHVLAVNVFERFSIEIIGSVLANLNTTMANGASLLFTFNNCDHFRGAEMVEQGIACYQTESLLTDILTQKGFIDIKATEFYGRHCVIEAKKPGMLEGIKHSPIIGRVTNINSLT